MTDLLRRIEQAFATPRPAHFTNHRHCCECAEHDETLRQHTPDSIGLAQLGLPGWDPICFINSAGFLYYFPALARLALEGTGDSYYLDQFLFHITYDGPRNKLWQACNEPQRKLVGELLDTVLEHRAEEVEEMMNTDELLCALEIWQERGA
jgi:hypothetical protein